MSEVYRAVCVSKSDSGQITELVTIGLFCKSIYMEKSSAAGLALAPRHDEEADDDVIIYEDYLCKKLVIDGFRRFKESGRKGLVLGVGHHQMDGVHAPLEGVPPNFPASVPR